MGWSTTVVSEPDGHMGDYIGSLEKLLARSEERYWPNHGTCIEDPQTYVGALLHIDETEKSKIERCLQKGLDNIEDLVSEMYKGLDPRLHNGACRAVHSHLIP